MSFNDPKLLGEKNLRITNINGTSQVTTPTFNPKKERFSLEASRFIFAFLFLILFINVVSPAPPITQISTAPTGLQIAGVDFSAIKVNTSRTAVADVYNASNGVPITSGISCTFKVFRVGEMGALVFTNSTPTQVGNTFYFGIPNTTYTTKAEYTRIIFCNSSTIGGFYKNTFYATNSGNAPAGDTFTMFIYILFVVSTIGLVTTFFLTIAKLVTTKETIFGILTSWAFVILNMVVNYLGKEYLLRTFVEETTDVLMSATIWSNGVLPLISLIITMFVVGTKKKKNLSVEEITGGFRRNG